MGEMTKTRELHYAMILGKVRLRRQADLSMIGRDFNMILVGHEHYNSSKEGYMRKRTSCHIIDLWQDKKL